MAGRRPVPTSAKVVKGTFQKCRQNVDEPTFSAPDLAPPQWLSERGKEAFGELARLLNGARVLMESDRAALAALCDTWAEYRDLRDIVFDLGHTYTVYELDADKNPIIGPDGKPMIRLIKAREEARLLQSAWSRTMRALVEFGLTPSSRTRIKAGKPGDNETSPWTDL